MTSPENFPTPHAVAVDWEAPHLQKLLRRVHAWQLDQRGGHAPQQVHLFIGWNSQRSHPGQIVWRDDRALVIQTTLSLSVGERVRIERPHAARAIWGEVIQSRLGQRPGDAEQGIQIHWVQIHAHHH